MVKIVKCTYCGNEIQPGVGVTYVRANGEIYNFCSPKCRKYKVNLNKNPRYVRWTTFYGQK